MLEQDIVEQFEEAIRNRINLPGIRVISSRGRFDAQGEPDDSQDFYRLEITFAAGIPITRAQLDDQSIPYFAVIISDSLQKLLLQHIDDWRKEVVYSG